MLNALRIVVLYNRMQAHPELDVMPRTFFFAGKAAPAYRLAKLIIKFLNNLAGHDRRQIRSSAAGSRWSSCPNTVSRWPNG